MAVELAEFNIRVLLVAPGSFRTEGIYRHSYLTTNQISDYDTVRNASIKRFMSVMGNEKGDPDKGMAALVDVVRGEGVAAGRPWPGLLVLGEDAASDVRTKSNKILETLTSWEDVSRGVSFDT